MAHLRPGMVDARNSGQGGRGRCTKTSPIRAEIGYSCRNDRARSRPMLPPKENELITRVGQGTPMGNAMRRYWIPACLASEIGEPDSPPVRVRLLGEDLVAFRDSDGRIGLIDEFCPHRRVSLFFGRNEECGLRCVYHGWKYDVEGNCV